MYPYLCDEVAVFLAPGGIGVSIKCAATLWFFMGACSDFEVRESLVDEDEE